MGKLAENDLLIRVLLPQEPLNICLSMARALSKVHGTWDKKTRHVLATKFNPGYEIEGRIDMTSLNTNKNLVVLESEPPINTESFHIERPVFTTTPDKVLSRSSTNQLLANRVAKEQPNVRTDFSSNLYSLEASTIEPIMLPELADLTTATSATVIKGVVATDPTNAGRTHVAHLISRDGINMFINEYQHLYFQT